MNGLYITQRHMQWMASGMKVTEEAYEAVAKIMKENFIDENRSDGSNRVRPSSLGKCLRMQALSYRGERSSFSGSAAAFNGTFSHFRWQLAGLSAGWLAEAEVDVSTNFRVSGSADGVLDNGDVLEIKTTGGSTYSKILKSGLPLANKMQAEAYMAALGTDTTRFIYEDRSYLEFKEIVYKHDPELLKQLKKDAKKVSKKKKLPPILTPCVEGKGIDFKWCSFKNSCKPWMYGLDNLK